jgi:hypothetical protein
MPKRTAKPLVYVPPPPEPDSSGPGRGVWSDTSRLKAIDNRRSALRQAIHDALLRLPPHIAEAATLRTLPGDMQLDAVAAVGLGLKTPWQVATEWKRSLPAFRRKGSPPELSIPKPVVVGTAELHVEKCWRFAPGHQSRDDVMAGILDEFTRELARELDAAYSHVKSIQARPSPRRNLDRDAMRLVLRTCFGLSNDEIRDYEEGLEVTLASGQVLVRPDGDGEAEDDGALDRNDSRRVRDTFDQSIKNFACDAEIPLPQQRLGRRPHQTPGDDSYKEYLA